MGTEYDVVNVAKRQFINIFLTGNSKLSGLMRGIHADVMGLFLVDGRRVSKGLLSLVGSWAGDPVHIPADEELAFRLESDGNRVFGYGFDTASPEDEKRNLYFMAEEEFHEVTRWMLKMLTHFGPEAISKVKDAVISLLCLVVEGMWVQSEPIKEIRGRMEKSFSYDEIWKMAFKLPRRFRSHLDSSIHEMIPCMLHFLAEENAGEIKTAEAHERFPTNERFIVVNPASRQYINAEWFGFMSHIPASLDGPHGHLMAQLMHRNYWNPPIYLAGELSAPNPPGIETATAERPTRNLYETAFAEFEDISLSAMDSMNWAEIVREGAAREDRVLIAMGNAVSMGYDQIIPHLIQHVGEDWSKKYKAARDKNAGC
jgi:hypothetical protein